MPSPSARRYLILANPVAGGGRARERAEALTATLRRDGHHVELFFTEGPGDARERAAATADEPRWDALIPAGGDGTLNEVIAGMPAPGVTVAPLRAGTANVLAVELDLPSDPEPFARMLHDDHTLPAAIGTANGRPFLLCAGAGIDGAMVRRMEEVRSGTLGKLRWTGPIWHVVRHWPHYELCVHDHHTGQTLRGLSSILVTRTRNYGSLLHLPGDIRIDDGLLHVFCFRQRTRWQWIRTNLKAVVRRLQLDRDVEALAGHRFTIRHEKGAAPVPYQVDGEFGGETPLELDVLDHPVRICCPV